MATQFSNPCAAVKTGTHTTSTVTAVASALSLSHPMFSAASVQEQEQTQEGVSIEPFAFSGRTSVLKKLEVDGTHTSRSTDLFRILTPLLGCRCGGTIEFTGLKLKPTGSRTVQPGPCVPGQGRTALSGHELDLKFDDMMKGSPSN